MGPTQATRDLLRKYDRPGPRYTSYPTAVEFTEDVGGERYARALASAARVDAPLSIYVHLPFCEERCLYCGCTVVITKKREVLRHYLDLLYREIRAVANLLGPRRRVAQLHWGGGTPTYLSPEEMRELAAVLDAEFERERGAEVAIEVDPRVTTGAHLEAIAALGFNRLSMGVQDFDADVQEAVNRIQPFEETRALIEQARGLGFRSINLDLIYGLPRQQPATFRDSLRKVLELRPERVAVYGYAHVPWLKGHQRRLLESELPDPPTRLALFAEAVSAFGAGGYRGIGMDHFALADDELAHAADKGTLWRNFMGYTVKSAPDIVAFGVSAIGDVGEAFFQNEKMLHDYERRVAAGEWPTARGYVLNEDDKLRRFLITSLMCRFRIDIAEVERRFRIDFAATFAGEREALREFEGDGLLEVGEREIRVLEAGRLFVRNICIVFDAHRRKPGDTVRFSRTV